MEKFLHGGNIYAEKPLDGEWLDFSANINPLGVSPAAKKALTENLSGIVNYPDPNARELKTAIADRYGVPPASIVLGNGAAELFYLFFFVMRFKKILIPVPSFGEYERAALAAGAAAKYFLLDAEKNFAPDAEKITAAMNDADCVIMGNPNNPTGSLMSKEDLLFVACRAKKRGAWLVADESFMDFRRDADAFSLQNSAGESENIFVVHSLTKFFALPGLRLGFGIAPPKTAAALDAAKDVWNVNFLAQKAGAATLGDFAYAERTHDLFAAETKFMLAELSKIPQLKIFPPSANFVLARIESDAFDAKRVVAAAKKCGILIRNCENYPNLDRSYIRFAIKNRAANEKLIAIFKTIFQGG